MLTIEEKIARSREKTRQLEIQKKLKDKRDQDTQRKLDTRRHTIIGRLVSKHFPDVSQFQPYRSEAENEIEFALLDTIISLIAVDKDYISHLLVEAETMLEKGCQDQ